MTILTLVRHGETVWQAQNRYAGSTDVELTDRGLRQAHALAKWSQAARLDAIVTTRLSRAWRTAEPSATQTGLTPLMEPRLTEVDFGEAEGLTKPEMRERFPEAVDAFHAAPADNPLPGGERGRDALGRALPAIGELRQRFPEGRVLVVGHSSLHRLLLCHWLGIDPNRYRDLMPEIRNVAVTTVRFSADSVALLEFNTPVY